MEPTPLVPQGTLEQAAALRAQGLPEELIQQLLGLNLHDPSGLAKQYEQSAYLRRAATSGDFAKSGAGVVAQGLAGFLSAKADKDYSAALRNYQGRSTDAKDAWWKAKYGTPARKPDEEIYD